MIDTIVAIGTPPGEGGIGIVRLSGPRSQEILESFFQHDSPHWGQSQRLVYGSFIDHHAKKSLDDGYAVLFKAPRSYTGEDAAEIYVHGSPVVLETIVQLAIREGARLAEAGEFTKRAFLNEKLDLVQAEAVSQLISSRSIAELEVARQRLDGKLSETLEMLLQNTKRVLAECEADVDFPDENLPLEKRTALLEKIRKMEEITKELLQGYEAGKRLHDGFLVAFVGAPNVGKSSLFNRLLMSEAAIVTDTPGTTRDLLREELILRGRRVRLVDTAGLRGEAQDEVERIGMERTMRAASEADLILFLCPAGEALGAAETRALEEWREKKKTFLVHTKADLKPAKREGHGDFSAFEISSKTGVGIAQLQDAIGAEAVQRTVLAEKGVASERQRARLLAFQGSLSRATSLWKDETPELAASDLRAAYRSICDLLGREASNEDILDEIFSQFCIGK